MSVLCVSVLFDSPLLKPLLLLFCLIKQEIFICVMVREKTLARDNDDNKKENDIFRDP